MSEIFFNDGGTPRSLGHTADPQLPGKVSELEGRIEELEAKPDYVLPVATTDTVGGVKVDGTTITAGPDGTISAVGDGSGPSLSDAVDSESSDTAASSLAVKTAYDAATAAQSAADAAQATATAAGETADAAKQAATAAQGMADAAAAAAEEAKAAAEAAQEKADDALSSLDLLTYDLGDRELVLYVRPDGSDSNDGTANIPESAWATIEHALAWISARKFTGGGLITVKLAHGSYTPSVNRLANTAQFTDSFKNQNIPDVIYPADCESQRVRLVGDVAAPSSVVVNIDYDYVGFSLTNLKVCGVTFSKRGTPSVTVDNIVSLSNSIVANCKIVIGITAASYFMRCSNSVIYGTLEINAEIPFTATYEIFTFYGASSGIGIGCHQLGTLTPGERPGKLSVTGSNVKANFTVSVIQSSVVFIRNGSGSGASAGNSTFTGIISASRYFIQFPSVLYTNGLGVNFFPGTSAGSADIPSSLYL